MSHQQPFMNRRKIDKHQFYSNHLAMERIIRVCHPLDHEHIHAPLCSAPIIICQDGEQFLNFGRIATISNKLAFAGLIRAPYIIAIDTIPTRRTEEYAPDGTFHEAYLRFMAEQLWPWLCIQYSFSQEASDILLVGSSLGATASLHLSLRYRNLFSRVISFSGAFFSPTIQQLEQESGLEWLEFYNVVGTDERTVKTERGLFDFLSANRLTRHVLEQKKCQLTYKEAAGRHIWGFWQEQLPDALLHMLGHPQ